jgi:hypothetical protein
VHLCTEPTNGQYVETACSTNSDTIINSVTTCSPGQYEDTQAIPGSSSVAGMDAHCSV